MTVSRLQETLDRLCEVRPDDAEVIAIFLEVISERSNVPKDDGCVDALIIELEVRRRAHEAVLSPAAIDRVCAAWLWKLH